MAADATTPATAWVGIVDDEPSIRRALARTFRAHGIAARAFSSAEEYLARVPDDEPSCLVLDVYLGGMNGFELRNRMGGDDTSPPIIFIGALDEVPLSMRERIPRLCSFLGKPFEIDQLLALVREYSAAGPRHETP